jgi:hypothetical protein
MNNEEVLKNRILELSHFILSNWKLLPLCQCEKPLYKGTDTPRICGSCGYLIGHSGMCDCGHSKNN